MSARIIYSAKAYDSGTSTIPEDVEYLVVQLAANYYYRNSSSQNTYAKSPSFPDEGFQSDPRADDLPACDMQRNGG